MNPLSDTVTVHRRDGTSAQFRARIAEPRLYATIGAAVGVGDKLTTDTGDAYWVMDVRETGHFTEAVILKVRSCA